FIRSTATRDRWLCPMIDAWVHGINSLASVATRFPHSAYAGLVSCLMAEWQYICRIIPNIGLLLEPIEDALCTKLLQAILGPDIAIDNYLWNLLALRVKAGRVTIQNPTLIADLLLHTSQDATSYLSGSLRCNEPMCTPHHRSAIRNTAASKDAFLQALLEHLPPKAKNASNKPVPLAPGSPLNRTASPAPAHQDRVV
ncbi:hypothetical protein ACHAW6_007531, partial [Cyclotella cf. meneghiniana]